MSSLPPRSLSRVAAACTAITVIFCLSFNAAAQDARYLCDIPLKSPPLSVQAASQEYFECAQPLIDEWFAQYPERIERYEKLYLAYVNAMGHDLRGRREAGRWIGEHSVDFSKADVRLTAAQSRELAPNSSAPPAEVAGRFDRLFVDRQAQRLFLTSSQEGLVSLDISQRYAYEVQGRSDHGGSSDFFIYDQHTAFMEQAGESGGDRDLIVLDISDMGDPIEVARHRGILPEAGILNAVLEHISDQPPSFEHYLTAQQGLFVVNHCGTFPTVSNHPGVRCRPDGSCYSQKLRDNADEGICRLQPLGLRRPRVVSGPITPRPPTSMDSSRRNIVSEDVFAQRVEQSATPPDAPQGGEGGAGSLSQMMVFDQTLYVLSGHQRLNVGWLSTFDVSNPRHPRLNHLMRLDNGPEALQRHDNLLLIAGRDALITVSLARPNEPRLLGEFRQNCPVNYDPVVVQGTVAYRTIIVDDLRSTCSSRLEVIDLSQPHQPILRSTHPIHRPRGLAILGQRLFVADESTGIQLFDLADPIAPLALTTWQLPGVNDLVISDFDLFAMTPGEVQTFYLGSLFADEPDLIEAAASIEGIPTVISP